MNWTSYSAIVRCFVFHFRGEEIEKVSMHASELSCEMHFGIQIFFFGFFLFLIFRFSNFYLMRHFRDFRVTTDHCIGCSCCAFRSDYIVYALKRDNGEKLGKKYHPKIHAYVRKKEREYQCRGNPFFQLSAQNDATNGVQSSTHNTLCLCVRMGSLHFNYL